MPYFLNLRSHPVGGWLDSSANVKVQLNPTPDANGFNQPDVGAVAFQAAMQGQHVLIATHGFNTNFYDGVGQLTNWGGLLQLNDSAVWVGPAVFVGLVWPGDSSWAHGLDYGTEPKVADQVGIKLAPFLDQVLSRAASVSFASHSLGARAVLQTVKQMKMATRRLILMAGAIDDNCMSREFQQVTGQVSEISALASKEDDVLKFAFPLGNLLGGIIDQGHPWWHGALGRTGPWPTNPSHFKPPFEIPDDWNYGHHNYLEVDPPPTVKIPVPVDVPPQGSPKPSLDAAGKPNTGWQENFSSAFVSTRFR